MFDVDKIEKLKEMQAKEGLNTGKVLKVLGDDILELTKSGYKVPAITKELEEIFGEEFSQPYIRQFIAKSKKGGKKIVAVVNFKGGSGKSTIANLLALDNKVIINLDDAQDAKKINNDTTYNLYELREAGVESIKEAIEGALEAGFTNIILDTPGDIQSYADVLCDIDYFIVPFKNSKRSIETTITTISTIEELLEDMCPKRKDRWCLIINDFSSEEELEDLEKVYSEAKEILGGRLSCKASLKSSQVIRTIEQKKRDVDSLFKENPIAYGVFKKRVRELNEKVKRFLGEKDE